MFTNGYVVQSVPMVASGWQHSISHDAIQIGNFTSMTLHAASCQC